MKIKNLNIVEEILKNEILDKISLYNKLKICRHPEKYFIGNGYKKYIPPMTIIYNGKEMISDNSICDTKIFEYNQKKDIYLDIADKQKYKKASGKKTETYVCDNLQCMDNKIKKIIWKRGN